MKFVLLFLVTYTVLCTSYEQQGPLPYFYPYRLMYNSFVSPYDFYYPENAVAYQQQQQASSFSDGEAALMTDKLRGRVGASSGKLFWSAGNNPLFGNWFAARAVTSTQTETKTVLSIEMCIPLTQFALGTDNLPLTGDCASRKRDIELAAEGLLDDEADGPSTLSIAPSRVKPIEVTPVVRGLPSLAIDPSEDIFTGGRQIRLFFPGLGLPGAGQQTVTVTSYQFITSTSQKELVLAEASRLVCVPKGYVVCSKAK